MSQSYDKEKLADYLDYLHMKSVKEQSQSRLRLSDVKQELSIKSSVETNTDDSHLNTVLGD